MNDRIGLRRTNGFPSGCALLLQVINSVNEKLNPLRLERLNNCLIGSMILRISPNHPVRSCQNSRRNCETDLLGGFQVDDQLEFNRLFDRESGWLSTL